MTLLESDLVDIDSALNDQSVDVLTGHAMVVFQVVLAVDCHLVAIRLAKDDHLKESIGSKREVRSSPLLTAPLLLLEGVAHHTLSLEPRVKVEGNVWPWVGAYTTLKVNVEPVWVCADLSTHEDESAGRHAVDDGSSVGIGRVDDASRSMNVSSSSTLEPNGVEMGLAVDSDGVNAIQVLDAMVILDEVLAIHSNLELVELTEDDDLKILVEGKREV